MQRMLKALGLALAATFALGMIGAGSASAENGVQGLVTLDEDPETAVITGGSHDIGYRAGTGGSAKFECTTSVFSGTVENNAKTINLVAPKIRGQNGSLSQTKPVVRALRCRRGQSGRNTP